VQVVEGYLHQFENQKRSKRSLISKKMKWKTVLIVERLRKLNFQMTKIRRELLKEDRKSEKAK